jgi:hypothetical protein
LQNASRQLKSFGSEVNNVLSRISANTKLQIATLGNNASAVRTLSLEYNGTAQKLQFVSAYLTEATQRLEGMRTAANANSTEIRRMESNLSAAALREQEMINKLEALKKAMANIRPNATMARLSYNQQMASIATQQLVANLGHEATAYQKAQATASGLANELKVNERIRTALTASINRLSNAEGKNVEELRKLKLALAEATLAGKNMENQMKALSEVQPLKNKSGLTVDDIQQAGFILSTAMTAPLLLMAREGMTYNSMIESNMTSFKTMLRDARQAEEIMTNIQRLAVVTPFETPDLAKQGTILAQYGMQAKNLLPTLKVLGDISMGRKLNFEVIAYNFAQAVSLGRLTAIDVRSMTQAGFNPLLAIAELRKKRGQTGGKDESQIQNDLRKQMEETGISIKELVDAMKMATSEGGRFYKAMENASKTFEGQLSTLHENFNIFLASIGKPLFEILRTTIFPALNKMLVYMSRFAEANPKITRGILGMTIALGSLGPALLGIAGAYQLWRVLDRVVIALNARWLIMSDRLLLVRARMAMAGGVIPWLINSFKALSLAGLTSGLLISAGIIVAVGSIYTMWRTWDTLKKVLEQDGAVLANIFTTIGAKIEEVFLSIAVSIGQAFDRVRTTWKDIKNGNFLGTTSTEESEFTANLRKKLEAAKEKYKFEKEYLEKSAGELEKLKNIFVQDFKDKLGADLKKILPTFDVGEITNDIKIPEIDTSAFTEGMKENTNNAEKEMESFVNKIKDMARQFRDALGLFDKAVVDKLSPGKLLARLTKQVKIYDTWQASIAVLKQRLGTGSLLFQDILSKGVSAAGAVKSLANMDMFTFNQYKALYERKAGISADLARTAVGMDITGDKKIEQISVNINGGLVLGNIDQLVEMVTRQLKIQGLI